MWAFLRCGVILAAFSLASLMSAQNLDRLLPEPVPPQLPDEPEAPQPELTDIVQLFGVRPEEIIVIPELKGIRLLSDQSQVTPRLTEMSSPIEFVGVPSMQTDEGIALLSLALGQPVSRESLDRLLGAIRVVLARTGAAFSIVALPPQDVTAGYLQLVVIESVVGNVRVEGNRWFSEQSYLSRLDQTPGQPVNARGFNDGPERINANPFRRATVEVAAGAEPGTTDIIVRARETRPWRFFVSANNTGTKSTKEERVSTGFNWGNVFGLGHQLSLQWNSSDDFNALRSVSGSYVADLPRRHSLRATASYSRSNALVSPPFSLRGESWQVGLDYEVPLTASNSDFGHTLAFGIDFKASDNNFTFAAIPITDNLTHIAQARVSYTGNLARSGSQTNFGLTLTGAPGGITDRNDDRYFTISRGGAKAAYAYLRANATHAIRLDQVKSGLTWVLRFQGQYSSDKLLGSEQMVGGGAYAVRGYKEDEVYGDHGILLGQELRLPPWTQSLGGDRGTLSVQGFVFQDYARLWNVNPLPAESAANLHSVGAGFDFGVGRQVSLRAAYGWQLRDNGSNESGRLHVSANVSF